MNTVEFKGSPYIIYVNDTPIEIKEFSMFSYGEDKVSITIRFVATLANTVEDKQ
jgi:hypothetical protein